MNSNWSFLLTGDFQCHYLFPTWSFLHLSKSKYTCQEVVPTVYCKLDKEKGSGSKKRVFIDLTGKLKEKNYNKIIWNNLLCEWKHWEPMGQISKQIDVTSSKQLIKKINAINLLQYLKQKHDK